MLVEGFGVAAVPGSVGASNLREKPLISVPDRCSSTSIRCRRFLTLRTQKQCTSFPRRPAEVMMPKTIATMMPLLAALRLFFDRSISSLESPRVTSELTKRKKVDNVECVRVVESMRPTCGHAQSLN